MSGDLLMMAQTWTEVNASPGWSARYGHTSVAMPDGSIVLMGGMDTNYWASQNDVWRSPDNGTTWTEVNANAGWSARYGHTSVAMPDGSIVLMGGMDNNSVRYNDVWRSTDNGATWTQINNTPGWSARSGSTSVVTPGGIILLMGGIDSGNVRQNDLWRSSDNGETWTLMTANAGWSDREGSSSVLMPDTSITLMGGTDGVSSFNDVWWFMPVSSSLQNPSHTYTQIGSYQVELQVNNTEGYNSTRKAGYIRVVSEPVADFNANTNNGMAPLTVVFSDVSSGNPASWVWDFGDGSSSTLQNPVHLFSSPGLYTVNLTITNELGSNTTSKTNYITLDSHIYPLFNGSPTIRCFPSYGLFSRLFFWVSNRLGLVFW